MLWKLGTNFPYMWIRVALQRRQENILQNMSLLLFKKTLVFVELCTVSVLLNRKKSLINIVVI